MCRHPHQSSIINHQQLLCCVVLLFYLRIHECIRHQHNKQFNTNTNTNTTQHNDRFIFLSLENQSIIQRHSTNIQTFNKHPRHSLDILSYFGHSFDILLTFIYSFKTLISQSESILSSSSLIEKEMKSCKAFGHW